MDADPIIFLKNQTFLEKYLSDAHRSTGGPAATRVRLQEKRELALPAELLVPDLLFYDPGNSTDLHMYYIYLSLYLIL